VSSTASDAADVRARLDERYGRRPARPGRRRALVALLAVVVAAVVAWAVWAAVALTHSAVTWQDAGAEVGPSAVRVSFVVRAAPGTRLVCAVRATDHTGALVGWLDVPIVTPESGRTTATATVPTSQPATGGGVGSCARR
jgi:Domain of unknown function (DUF4307)